MFSSCSMLQRKTKKASVNIWKQIWNRDGCENPHKHQFSHLTPAWHSHKDHRINCTHKRTDRTDIAGNSGVFGFWGGMEQLQKTMTSKFLLSVPYLERPLLKQAHIHHPLVSACRLPTHSAQQQQHAAHHNGYHNGQLAPAKLHFGNGMMKVPHLHLQRERATTHDTGLSSFKSDSSFAFLPPFVHLPLLPLHTKVYLPISFFFVVVVYLWVICFSFITVVVIYLSGACTDSKDTDAVVKFVQKLK